MLMLYIEWYSDHGRVVYRCWGFRPFFFNSFSNDMLQILGLQTLLVFFIVNCYDRMVFFIN